MVADVLGAKWIAWWRTYASVKCVIIGLCNGLSLARGLAQTAFCELIEAEWRTSESINYVIIGSDNGFSPIWHQAIILNNGSLSLSRTLNTYFNEIPVKISQCQYKKMKMKKCYLRCVGNQVFRNKCRVHIIRTIILNVLFLFFPGESIHAHG